MLKLTNTLTKKKEIFEVPSGPVTMYVCGITPYDYTHIGHGRCYIVFDLLYRVLRFMGYTVSYCRNITDIDDKLLIKAQEKYNDMYRYPEVAQPVIADFHERMRELNCVPPTHEPRVTQHIPTIIAFIEQLIGRGYAYVSHGDVYFSIETFPAYGQLSKQKIDELCASMRVDVREHKKNPLDFALWKAEPKDTFWQSPWGYGRPGWHIECSALAAQFLGEHITIHGGGIDLIFPHHENEIAQSQARFNKQFVHYWVHNGLVMRDTEKMSKSLGNALALHTLLQQFDPMVIRFYLLSHHYRMPLEFSFEGLHAAQKGYERLCRVFDRMVASAIDTSSSIIERMRVHLYDDLNTPGMFGILFESLDELVHDQNQKNSVGTFIRDVLGLSLQPLPEKKITVTPEIQKLLDERERARAAKDFKRADALRDQLRELGFEVQDTKIN